MERAEASVLGSQGNLWALCLMGCKAFFLPLLTRIVVLGIEPQAHKS